MSLLCFVGVEKEFLIDGEMMDRSFLCPMLMDDDDDFLFFDDGQE